jgi:hypothetical protein
MDLLDKINSLTDDQLQMVAERDDASGVLASYRLAELRGLPAPDRSVVIMGEGYAIVAQDGVIQRIATEGVTKIIREEDGEYCVYSEDGSRSFGCYPTMGEAEERLRQIHFFGDETEKALREGSFVSWNSSGGRARGRIEHVMTEGVLGVPGSDFSINAEPDDPAVLIRIWQERAEGWVETETLVGHKMSTLTSIEPLNKESFVPPEGVQEAGQRALDWIAEGHAGSGFTDVGRARAAQLARGDAVSEETIRRMASFLARHEGDSRAEGFSSGEEGFPSAGRVAWDAWGGDAGKTWAEMMVARFNREEDKQACPIATGDVAVNLKNRQTAIEVADYGPLNPALSNDEYWEHLAEYFETSPNEARSTVCGNCAAFDKTSHMQDCIAEGITEGDGEPDPYDVVDAGDLGYCRIFKFKCASARTCSAWISGGPITDETAEPKELAKAQFMKKADEKQFTLGPLYVPDFMDSHGEWTDSEELQNAVWGWVRSGDRRIFLQHDTDVVAGEWVEVMTMPQPWTVDMMDAAGGSIGQVTYPKDTVFLGVVWNDKAWADVKAGRLRGYSIGGYSDRMMADLPVDGEREGLAIVEPEQTKDLTKAIADAITVAMKNAQPVVNVVMSDERKARVRRIERDEHGNIARIIEEEEV